MDRFSDAVSDALHTQCMLCIVKQVDLNDPITSFEGQLVATYYVRLTEGIYEKKVCTNFM